MSDSSEAIIKYPLIDSLPRPCSKGLLWVLSPILLDKATFEMGKKDFQIQLVLMSTQQVIKPVSNAGGALHVPKHH